MGLFDFIKREKTYTVNEGINKCVGMKGILLDVRRKEDYKKGHVNGAANAPLANLEISAKTRLRDKDKPIFIIGSYEERPEKAAKLLRGMGYTQVFCSGCMEEHYGLLKKG